MICKRCDTTLLPSITSTHRIQSSPVTTLVTTCKVCKAKKRYAFHNKDYELFNDKAAITDENTFPKHPFQKQPQITMLSFPHFVTDATWYSSYHSLTFFNHPDTFLVAHHVDILPLFISLRAIL
ncbi:hypothetical protein RO3G_05722 [Rhizopus delemar RA 99-880]|uniref:Uncharacterized protein n=1 Tax=Rhizopus delemar (strain RA 99-880 / ATCC MYA-4621 / FGSC 9543 / NRRL 43880) TaxID=246409 RepID=I1BXT7_RHIO9|nr:hypothetical protein RO3G_05722 [Rhizopus delemar RA 99-880]|eukprot:EIE81017.1 hypothetical protein RO3G_05722 [Rhizopus delemar RA 99-880]